MKRLHSLQKTINRLEELSNRLNPELEPLLPNREEQAVYISTCWPMTSTNALKEQLDNVD